MIKNYTSNSKQTFDIIKKCLIEHKANQIMFEYDDNGKTKSLNFALKIDDKFIGFKLPARVEKVEGIFLAEKKKKIKWQYERDRIQLSEEDKQQAYRTAWANIRDWLTAQMALIDTEQVKMEEVFLPYAVTRDNKTYFEAIQENKYQLPSGAQEGVVVTD